MNLHRFGLWMFTHVLILYSFEALASDDFYDLLGIKKNASQKDIKRAFHKMATKYHPDKNKQKGAEELFRQVAQAYEVLSDPEKKKQYDRYGKASFESGSGSEAYSHSFAFASFDEIFKSFDDGFNSDDPFHFSFDGNEFEGMGRNHEEDQFSNFGFGDMFNDHFGHGDSFFGTHFGRSDSHFQESTFQQVHKNNERFSESRSQSGGHGCRTVTQKIGNMVTTYTQCS